MKAARASVTSCAASMPAFQVATNSRPCVTVRPSLADRTALVPSTASGEFAAISAANARAAACAAFDVVRHFVDQADLLGPEGGDVLAGEGELGEVAGSDDGRQSLEAPQIGDDGNLGLADRERRVGGGEADVARRDEVHSGADTAAVDGSDHGLGAAGDRCHSILEPDQLGPGGPGLGRTRLRRQGPGRRRGCDLSPLTQQVGHGLEVQADGEMGPGGGHHHDPNVAVAPQRRHGSRQVAPRFGAHGVAGLGAVQPQPSHRVVHLNAQDRRFETRERVHTPRLTALVRARAGGQ